MIREDGPIASTEFGLQTRQVTSGGGRGAFGIQTVVANGNAVRHPAPYGAVDGPGSFAPHKLARGDGFEPCDSHDTQSCGAGGGFRELHEASRPGGTGGLSVAPTFQIRDGRQNGCRPTAFGRGAAEDGSQARPGDSFGA